MARRLVLLAGAGVCLMAVAQAHAQPPAATPPPGTEVEEVVVTASPITGDPDRFATIVEKVTRDDVLGAGGANIADALRDTPGVAGSGFAAGASRPVIRGMDAQRVKMVENGLSSSDVSDVGPDHGIPIDPLSSQAIEVVRGAGTLRYGSQAIGGVVNSFNNRIPRSPISGTATEALAAYNSVSNTGEGAVSINGGAGPAAFHLDGFARRASDYDTPLGVQANSFFIGSGYSAGASYFFGDGNRVGAAGTHYQSRYGIPAEDTYIAMHQDKGEFGSSFKFKDGGLETLNVDAGYATYSHSEIDPGGAVLSTFNNREWDGRAEALFGAIGRLTGSAVGVQLQDRRFDAEGEGADYLLPTHTQNAAGFAFAEAPLGPLQFQGAVRLEGVRIQGTPASGIETRRDFAPLSASLGFSYEVSDRLRLGLTAASAARAPAQTELFAKGPHDGPQTFETGDPRLGLERANSLEGTARVRIGSSGRIDASLWGARFQDYIFGALTGRVCGEDGTCAFGGPGDLKELNYRQRDAQFSGAEIKGSAPLGKALGGELSAEVLADYVRAKFGHGGGDVPRIQPGRAGGGLAWTSARLDASFLILAVSPQRRVGVADSPTPGYTSVDAQIAWRPFGEARRTELLLVGHNLADEEIRNATALNKDEVVMPGRDIRLVARTRF